MTRLHIDCIYNVHVFLSMLYITNIHNFVIKKILWNENTLGIISKEHVGQAVSEQERITSFSKPHRQTRGEIACLSVKKAQYWDPPKQQHTFKNPVKWESTQSHLHAYSQVQRKRSKIMAKVHPDFKSVHLTPRKQRKKNHRMEHQNQNAKQEKATGSKKKQGGQTPATMHPRSANQVPLTPSQENRHHQNVENKGKSLT